MSLFSRRKAFAGMIGLSAGLLLAGCFRPMLAEGSLPAELRGRVALPEIDGRFGYFLSKSLEDRLGEVTDAKWVLSVRSNVKRQGLAVAQDNSVTRITLFAQADWELRRRSNGEVVLKDKANSQSGFNATTSLFATRQTEQDVERRLARDIGERIARRIYAKAGELGG